MSDISVNNFNRYDMNPNNVRGKFTSDEIMAGDEAFTKTFLQASHKVQIEILNKLSSEAKDTLYTSLKKHYRDGDPQSKIKCQEALVTVGANMIITSRKCNDAQDIAKTTLEFMHYNIVFQDKADNPAGRDACEWSGPKVLAEGNFNGCVEANKTFISLFQEAVSQKGLRSVKSNYISSFAISSATRESLNKNIEMNQCQPGHAVTEISYQGGTFLVDATAMESDLFESRNVTFTDLKDRSIIKYADMQGNYTMDTENGPQEYKLFGRGITYNIQSNKFNLFDRSTSDGATRRAVQDYLNALK